MVSKSGLKKEEIRPTTRLKNRILLRSSKARALQRRMRQRKMTRAIDRYAELRRPDLAIAFMNGMGIPIAMSKELKDTKKIYSFRKTPEYEFKFGTIGSNLHLSGLHLHDVLGEYDAITVLIPAYRDKLDQSIKDRVKYIPNPIFFSEADTAHKPLLSRSKTILFVGRLIESKRPAHLLSAWRLICKKNTRTGN